MKKTEAIEYIKKNCYGEWCEDDWREAMDMAIEALKCSERTAETAQPDHTADIGKKVFISCGHENDQISRQALYKYAQNQKDKSATPNDIMWFPSAQPDNQINLCDSCDYLYPECPSEKDDVIFGNGIGNDNICACNKYKPPAQPDRKLIDDYMWKIKQNISSHTAAEGVIAIKYYLSQIYEQIYGKGEKPKWMT